MKIGDYVRTKSYGIKKINGFSSTLEEDFIDCDYDKLQRILINKKEVVKSSPNIIDLIQDGDIIHYHDEYIDFISPVIVYDDGEIASNLYDSDGYIFLDKEKDKNNIKSIVTEEQFKSMEYRIGE